MGNEAVEGHAGEKELAKGQRLKRGREAAEQTFRPGWEDELRHTGRLWASASPGMAGCPLTTLSLVSTRSSHLHRRIRLPTFNKCKQ